MTADDTVVVKVGVEGKVSGSLYLLGKIGYDVATRSVLIGDLRYTLESSSKMSSIKATLGASRIRKALADATGIPLSTLYRWRKEKVAA